MTVLPCHLCRPIFDPAQGGKLWQGVLSRYSMEGFNMKRLSHNARVLVTDGGRATVFRNVGDVGKPDLQSERHYHQDNPPNHEQARDAPSRVMESVGYGRSTAEQPDYHQMTEDRFVKGIAADMAKVLTAGPSARSSWWPRPWPWASGARR